MTNYQIKRDGVVIADLCDRDEAVRFVYGAAGSDSHGSLWTSHGPDGVVWTSMPS